MLRVEETITPNMALLPGEVAQVVESVFRAMLNLEVTLGETPWSPSRDRLTASVHLACAWNGAVLFECSREQARLFAGRFLSIDSPETVDDVVRDVLGELANMIGGNLKCVLTQGIRLSMPSVVDGIFNLRVCGAQVRERLAFECDEGPFWITVLTTS
jgi:CheY-specific phosphatase CheX